MTPMQVCINHSVRASHGGGKRLKMQFQVGKMSTSLASYSGSISSQLANWEYNIWLL